MSSTKAGLFSHLSRRLLILAIIAIFNLKLASANPVIYKAGKGVSKGKSWSSLPVIMSIVRKRLFQHWLEFLPYTMVLIARFSLA